MKYTNYVIMTMMATSLIFSQGKACCKNKTKKSACNSNQNTEESIRAKLEADQAFKKLIDQNNDGVVSDNEIKVAQQNTPFLQNEINSNQISCNKSCNKSKKNRWWKFWNKN